MGFAEQDELRDLRRRIADVEFRMARLPIREAKAALATGLTVTRVAVIESISAATETDADGRTTITATAVTAKRLEKDETGKWYYDPVAAADVECEWPWKTPVNISTSTKWRRGLVIDGELFLVDCGEFTDPVSSPP